ncbi:MAG: hypothetical protein WAW23_08450 [Candidatus Methanoperedens sp.]
MKPPAPRRLSAHIIELFPQPASRAKNCAVDIEKAIGAKIVIEHGFARIKKSVGIRRIRVIRVLLCGFDSFSCKSMKNSKRKITPFANFATSAVSTDISQQS